MPTHYQGSEKETLALDTWIKLTRAADSFAARVSPSRFERLTDTQFAVLESLLHLGPLPQCVLASKLLKSSGNITLVIDNLEKRGLVQRLPDTEDRRVTRVSLTDQGRILISGIFPLHAQTVAEEMSVLTSEEQVQLGFLCKKLGKNVKQDDQVT